MVKCLSTFRGNGEKIFFHIFFCKNEKYLYGKNQKGNQGNVEKLRRKRLKMKYKSFIFEVRSRYREFRPSEQKAADIILNEDKRILDWTIEEFAQAAGVSQPTVIRFARALGLKGYRELKNKVLEEYARKKGRAGSGGNPELSCAEGRPDRGYSGKSDHDQYPTPGGGLKGFVFL